MLTFWNVCFPATSWTFVVPSQSTGRIETLWPFWGSPSPDEHPSWSTVVCFTLSWRWPLSSSSSGCHTDHLHWTIITQWRENAERNEYSSHALFRLLCILDLNNFINCKYPYTFVTFEDTCIFRWVITRNGPRGPWLYGCACLWLLWGVDCLWWAQRKTEGRSQLRFIHLWILRHSWAQTAHRSCWNWTFLLKWSSMVSCTQ